MEQYVIRTLAATARAIVAAGLATQVEIEAAIDSLSTFVDDPRTIVGDPKTFQVWGRRPD